MKIHLCINGNFENITHAPGCYYLSENETMELDLDSCPNCNNKMLPISFSDVGPGFDVCEVSIMCFGCGFKIDGFIKNLDDAFYIRNRIMDIEQSKIFLRM